MRLFHSSRLALAGALLFAGTGVASALSLPFEEADYLPPEETTTYVERSLNHQAPLTIEHPRLPRRTGDAAAYAGFCRPAGSVRRPTEDGPPVLRQREICDNIAPRTLWPWQIGERPVYPRNGVSRRGLNALRELKEIERVRDFVRLRQVVRVKN